jgi:hypothetical protein
LYFRSPGGAALLQQLDLTPKRNRRSRVATTPAEDDAAPPQQKQDDDVDVQVDEAGDVADAAAQVDVAVPPQQQQAQVDAMDADGDQDWLVFVLGLILIAMVQMYILN